ncbi:MAG: SLBB domain-containing protein [Aquabacterium sp.]|uniref:SLBB domain-containing protein n=1 Tax=Aquabacterium sp. TaxID=1872578 RepID=UPI0025BF3783|nr:SLBB domain-containing protein [Aquabacterium sp.]MBI3382873.1 SLBB domain-containing protein [Aquabacterium sp.]
MGSQSSDASLRLDGRLPGLPGLYSRQSNGLDSNNAPQGATAVTPQSAQQIPSKPLPPNEFQRFVLETSGQALPLFGTSFFSQASAAYVPQSNAPVSPDYRVGPGDEMQIRGWGAVDIDVRAVVDRDGMIHIPRIGAVSLNGIRSAQAEDVIRAAIGKYYRDFQLSVTMGQLRGITVYVVGQARKPGSYTLSSSSTLVSALFASGGPNQNGSMRHVQVKRAEKTVTDLDLYAFLAKGDKSADIKLQDGDTIVIPAAKGFVALSGKVANSAVYELAGDGETIGSMLAVAGGLPVVADPKRAQLERLDPNKKPARTVEAFALDAQGLSKKLRSGDLLTVSALVPEFGNAVTLRGNVAQPIRSPWRSGMKIRDLIPDKAYLMSRASIKRQNEVMLSDEDRLAANADGFPDDASASQPRYLPQDGAVAQGGQPLQRGQNRGAYVRTSKEVRDNADTLADRIGNLVDEINLDYAVIERVDAVNVSVKLLPFSLGKALEDANSPDNLALQPGDIVTVFSVNDVRVPQAKRQVFVRVEGEVQRPGIYQMQPGDGLPQLIEKAGGLTPDAYLFGSGFFREEVKRAQTQNLEQLVRRLEAQVDTRLSAAAASVSSSDAGVAQIRVQAEAQAQKQALERLRNLKPSGRIMLGLNNDQVQPNKLPALRLENQDRLVVPARPDFVYVLGSVNTESSLIWRQGASVQQYLDQSGLTSGADIDEIFVLRADGSVLTNTGRWFSSVRGATVLPGDVIVLPEKTDHESAWSVFTRNAKDITQIVYQFSLGAAAIKTLRQ